jgi:hypothetical protein
LTEKGLFVVILAEEEDFLPDRKILSYDKILEIFLFIFQNSC